MDVDDLLEGLPLRLEIGVYKHLHRCHIIIAEEVADDLQRDVSL